MWLMGKEWLGVGLCDRLDRRAVFVCAGQLVSMLGFAAALSSVAVVSATVGVACLCLALVAFCLSWSAVRLFLCREMLNSVIPTLSELCS